MGKPPRKIKVTIGETPEQRRKTVEDLAPNGQPESPSVTQPPTVTPDPADPTTARIGLDVLRPDERARDIQERGEDTGRPDILPR